MSNPCVVVLGMHRSGTTAAAAALHHLGFTMGHELFGPNDWNAKGYFEDASFVRFDDGLLGLMQRRWDSPLPPADADFAILRHQQPAALELLRSRHDTSTHWGIKDPRMCLLEPFWSEAFLHAAVHPRYLITIRRPSHVARSLGRRDGISGTRAAWLWLAHVAGTLRYAKKPGVSRFVAFDDLIDKPDTRCRDLAAWLGHKPSEQGIAQFANEFLAPHLAHRSDEGLPEMPAIVSAAFQLLADAAAGDVDPCDFAAGDAWQATLATFEQQVMPTLRLVDGFFRHDQQLDVYDRRVAALASGLDAAEKLAFARAKTVTQLEHSLSDATDALRRAESLAAERQAAIAALEERIRVLTAAFAHAEKLALDRFAEIKTLTDRIRSLQSPPQPAEDRQ